MAIRLNRQVRKLTLVFAAAAMMSGCGFKVEEAAPFEECVQTSDAAAFQEKLPDLYKSFKQLDDLPYTGHPVTVQIKDGANNMQSCRTNTLEKEVYADFLPKENKLRVDSEKVDARAYAHEMFHAKQKLNGTFNKLGTPAFTIEDSIAGNMLVEASAVGYSFITAKEMSKIDPAAYDSFTSEWYSFSMRSHFDSAYEKAYASGANLSAEQREIKALEAGGKAVVEGLMSGANLKWAAYYAQASARNNAYTSGPAARERDGYAAERTELYRSAGEVSKDINITPDKLLAANPERAITIYLAKTGIIVKYFAGS